MPTPPKHKKSIGDKIKFLHSFFSLNLISLMRLSLVNIRLQSEKYNKFDRWGNSPHFKIKSAI